MFVVVGSVGAHDGRGAVAAAGGGVGRGWVYLVILWGQNLTKPPIGEAQDILRGQSHS